MDLRSRRERRSGLPSADGRREIVLFLLAALAEIGGAWLVWQGVREHRGWAWIGAGILALGGYGFVATLQPDPHFGRILAAYGGVFVAGSLAWGMAERQPGPGVAGPPGRGSIWIFGPGPAPATRRPARTSTHWSRPTVAATSGRASTAPAAYAAIASARPLDPPRMPTAVTSLSASSRVST